MVSTLGRWILQKAGVYSPLSGVTTKQSEGFNCALKRLQSWREIPVDAVVMALYHLQTFCFNEAQRGLSGKYICSYKTAETPGIRLRNSRDTWGKTFLFN